MDSAQTRLSGYFCPVLTEFLKLNSVWTEDSFSTSLQGSSQIVSLWVMPEDGSGAQRRGGWADDSAHGTEACGTSHLLCQKKMCSLSGQLGGEDLPNPEWVLRGSEDIPKEREVSEHTTRTIKKKEILTRPHDGASTSSRPNNVPGPPTAVVSHPEPPCSKSFQANSRASFPTFLADPLTAHPTVTDFNPDHICPYVDRHQLIWEYRPEMENKWCSSK